MNIRVFFSIYFISALSSCIYGQNDREIIEEITNKVTHLEVSKDKSFDYLIGGKEILSKNLKDIEEEKKHQQITICCSNGVLCCGDGKIFELDNNGINNIDNFNQHDPVFTYINTNNHDSKKQIKYVGEIGNDNENENAKLLNTLKTELDNKKIDFEKKLLDKIISILENVFNGIDDRKDINISQYLKKKNDLVNLVLTNINNQNGQNQIVLKLENIYSFISELDKMFTSNSVFTGEVSELKLYNRPIIIYDQANNENYREKVACIDDLKKKILKKMDFCVADSIFEKINKEEFFKISNLGKIEESLNFLKENYMDLFQNLIQQNNNNGIFFVNLKDFFGIICKKEQYNYISEDTDHYNDINGILVNIKYKEDEQINYSTFIKKIQKNLVGIYKKLLLIYFEKYLEGQKNKINDDLSGFLDDIIEKIENKSVDFKLFFFVSKIYAENNIENNIINQEDNIQNDNIENKEENIVKNKEIIKKIDLSYFETYFNILEKFRENITFDELNGFKKWFVLSNLHIILNDYDSFLDNLDINQKNWFSYIYLLQKCEDLLDQQQDFSMLLSIIGNLYEYYLKENPQKNLIKDYLERIKFLQDVYPKILREINPNEFKTQVLDLNKTIEDLLSSHFGNLAAEEILDFVKEFKVEDKKNNLMNVNKKFIENKDRRKFSKEELEEIFSCLGIKSFFLNNFPLTCQDFSIKEEKIGEIINYINLAIINSLLIKIDKFVKKNKNKVLDVNKLKLVKKLKNLLVNENEIKEEGNKDEEKEEGYILNLNTVLRFLNNILDGFGLEEEKNILNKIYDKKNEEIQNILNYVFNINEQGELLENINKNLNDLSKTIDEKKKEITKKKEQEIITVFTKYLKQCNNLIPKNEKLENINYLEKDSVSKFLKFHDLLKKWKDNFFIKGKDILNIFEALKNFKTCLIDELPNEKKKKKLIEKKKKEELNGINEKDILKFEENENFNNIKNTFYDIVKCINEATKNKLMNMFGTLQKLNDEQNHNKLFDAIQKEDNCWFFENIEDYSAEKDVKDILSFFNGDDINIWVLNKFAQTIDKCLNEKKDDKINIAKGFSIPWDMVQKIIGEKFENFRNQEFLNKLSKWYNVFSERLKRKILNLINNCIYLVNTKKGKKYLFDFLKIQLEKDNLPKYIKNDNLQNNKIEFENKMKKLEEKNGEKYNDIDALKKDGIIGKSYNITNPLFRYFVAYCMYNGVDILPNPDLNNGIKKKEKDNNNILEKEEKENKDEKQNEIKEKNERIDLYTYLTRNYSNNTRKDLGDDSSLEKDKDKNPSFKELEDKLFDCNKNDEFLHDYLDEKIDLDPNKKEEIINLFSEYIIPFSSDVQEVFKAKLCQKVSGDVVEGDETVENLGTKGTAAEAFVYRNENHKDNPLLIKIVRPEMQCKSEVKMLYETLINLKIKSEQRTNHEKCDKDDCSCKNVIKIHNVFYCKDSISKYFNGTLIVVMEYAGKGDMKNKIKNDGKDLSLSTISSYFKQLVNGLEFLHKLNILHMDVKLANIVYGDDGNLKLIDFGYSIFYNKEKNLKEQIKYVPSNSFWVMSLQQFKIFFKQFEIEIKEKCNKKIEKEIQEFITKYFFGDNRFFSHQYEKNEGFNIFDRIDKNNVDKLKKQFEEVKNIAKIGIKLKNLTIGFRDEKLDQKEKEKKLKEFLKIYDIYDAIITLREKKIDKDTTKDVFISKYKKEVFSKKDDLEFFEDYFKSKEDEISKKVCEHYYDEQKIKKLDENFKQAKDNGEFKEGYNVFQSDWCALLTYVLALSYRPFFAQVFIEDLEKDAKDKLEQIDRQKLDNILEKYCFLLFNSIFKVKVNQNWEDSNDVSKKYTFDPKNIFLHEDINGSLHYSIRNVLEYIMNTCFVHDENFKEKEKEIVDFLKNSSLYNYKESKKVKEANEEARKRVDEFLSGDIETLSEKYKQCENVKKLVVIEEITDIEKFKNRNLIGANFLVSCKDKQEQPKFFIFEEKKENNQKNNKKEKEKEKEKENNIEIEIVNGKKIKVTKGDKRALDLKKQKYALFKIKTKEGKEVYLYCSDIEFKIDKNNQNNGFFERCEHSDISVIACDTSKITNMARMFSRCENLKYLDISEIDTSNVTNMAYMFFDCEQIKNLNISNFDVKNVNNIYSMFGCCENLQTLNFKHFNDLDKNTECEDLFYGCKNLTKIEMDDFDRLRHFTKEKKNAIFQDCDALDNEWEQNNDKKEQNKNLEIVRILEGKIEEEKQKMKEEEEKKIKEEEQKMKKKVEKDIKAYEKIRKQKEKKINKKERSNSFDKSNIKMKKELFELEKPLYVFEVLNEEEVLKDKIEINIYVNKNIGQNRTFKIFKKIKNKDSIKDTFHLKDDYVEVNEDENGNHKIAYQNENKNPLNLEEKKYALFEIKTQKEETVYLYCSNVESSVDEYNGHGIFEDMDHINISVIACDTEEVANMNSMFSGCRSLKNLEFGKNFHTKNVKDMRSMFEGCSSLKELNLENFNTTNVTNMWGMFDKCRNLKELNLESFNTSNVENMAYMFSECRNLKKINFGQNFNTTNVAYMNSMFDGCSSLEKLEFSEEFNTTKVLYMDSMFDGCRSLKNLEFGKNFHTKIVKSMGSMFKGCSSLKELNLESFNTSNVENMGSMFKECSSLEKLNLESFNTSNVENISSMFSGCSSLKELNLKNFEIKNESDIEKMLYYCISLKKLTISNSLYNNLLNNGEDIFKGCYEIKNFYKNKSDKEILQDISKNKVIEVKDKDENKQKDEEEKSLEDLLSEKVTKLNIKKANNLNENKIGNEINNLNEKEFENNNMKKAVKLFPLLDFYLKHTKKEDRLYKHIFEIAELYKDFTEEQNLSDYFLSKYQDKIIQIGNSKILSKIDLIEQCLKTEILEKLKEKNKNKINEKDLKDEELLVYIKEYTKEEEEENKKKKEDKNKNKNEKDNKKNEENEELFINSVWKDNNIVCEEGYYEDWIVLDICKDKAKKQQYSVKNINSIEIGQEKIGLFKNVQNIESIKISIPENFIEEINDLSYMFYGCNQLKEVTWEIKDGITKKISNVTNFSHMFYNCIALYRVNFEVFDTRNVTDMSYMFYNCEDIANISEQLHTQIYRNFESNLYATCFNQPFDYEGKTYSRSFINKDTIFNKNYWQFYKEWPNNDRSFVFNLNPLKEIVQRVYKFYQYISEQGNKEIPNDFKEKCKEKAQDYKKYLDILDPKKIEINLFQLIVNQILGLKDEDPIIKEWLDYIINKQKGTFNEKEPDEKKYPNLNIYKDWEKEYYPYNLDLYTKKINEDGKTIDVKNSRYSKEILDRKNLNCEDKFDFIDLFFLSKKFTKSCNKIKFENFDTSNVNNMAYMFYGCKYLYELDLRNWNLENVRNFEGMFAECRSLRNLTLGKNKDLIKNEIVENKNEIIEENIIEIEENIIEEKNKINKKPTILRNYMFYNCKNLRDLDISDEVAKIDDPTESRNMLLGTTKLRTISCNPESEKAIKKNKEILGLCKDYKKTYEEMKKNMKEQVNFAEKEEFKIKKEKEEEEEIGEEEVKEEEEGKRGVKDENEILDYNFYDRDKINNFIKCTNIFTIEELFKQYKNNFKFDVIEISDINSKNGQVEEFMKGKIKNKDEKENYVFDIICKEKESGKYRNYIIYTNKFVSNFFENNKCIIYVDCLYAEEDIIDTMSMFSECTELLFVDISKIKMENLNHTFYLCENLKYVFLPKSDFEICDFSFYGCCELKLVINIEKCSNYSKNNNFNTSEKLLYFMATKKQSEYKNELKCKYFDKPYYTSVDSYPTNNSSYIITKDSFSFINYVDKGYSGKFLISQSDMKYLQKYENKMIEEQEEKKNKEKEKKEEEEEEIKEKKKNEEEEKENKEKEKTHWEKDIVKSHIKTFEEFKFDKDDFDIVNNENKEEVKTVDQIFYRFVQDEIKEIDDFLKKNMDEWNSLNGNEKTYEKFKNVFVFDYKRKNLFVP